MDDLSAFGSSTGKTQHEVIEEQQRIMDAAHQNQLNQRIQNVRIKSSSLDYRRKQSSDAPPPCVSASFPMDVDIAGMNPAVPGVNPVYEYKYNRSRGIFSP